MLTRSVFACEVYGKDPAGTKYGYEPEVSVRLHVLRAKGVGS